MPAGQYTNDLFDPETRGDTDILYTTFWPNIPDPLDWMQTTAVSGGTFNPFGYDGIDADHAAAVGTEDEGERAKLVAEMEEQLHEDMAPMVPGGDPAFLPVSAPVATSTAGRNVRMPRARTSPG